MVVGDDYHKMNPDNDKRAASSSVGKGTNTWKSCHLNQLLHQQHQEDQRRPPPQQKQPLVASFVDVVGTDGDENDKDEYEVGDE